MNQIFFAGVDVGGTNIKVGIVDLDGEVIAHDKFPTRPNDAPNLNLKNASDCISRLVETSNLSLSDLNSVGLATPGPMDIPSGMILSPFNLPGWRNQNVQQILTEYVERPVVFANDAGAAAYGEYWAGEGKEYSSAILITLGTGVGGGIIIDDRSLDGAHSHGAEIGHMIVDSSENARICSCGNAGHLEAYASATGITAIAAERLGQGIDSQIKDMINDDSPLSTLKIYEAAENGDVFANAIIMETAKYIGMAISSLAHVVDPEVVLLGGAMNFGGDESKTGTEFINRIREEVKKRSLPIIAEKLIVNFAKLGSDAGFIGAAGLAKTQIYDQAVTA